MWSITGFIGVDSNPWPWSQMNMMISILTNCTILPTGILFSIFITTITLLHLFLRKYGLI